MNIKELADRYIETIPDRRRFNHDRQMHIRIYNISRNKIIYNYIFILSFYKAKLYYNLLLTRTKNGQKFGNFIHTSLQVFKDIKKSKGVPQINNRVKINYQMKISDYTSMNKEIPSIKRKAKI